MAGGQGGGFVKAPSAFMEAPLPDRQPGSKVPRKAMHSGKREARPIHRPRSCRAASASPRRCAAGQASGVRSTTGAKGCPAGRAASCNDCRDAPSGKGLLQAGWSWLCPPGARSDLPACSVPYGATRPCLHAQRAWTSPQARRAAPLVRREVKAWRVAPCDLLGYAPAAKGWCGLGGRGCAPRGTFRPPSLQHPLRSVASGGLESGRRPVPKGPSRIGALGMGIPVSA